MTGNYMIILIVTVLCCSCSGKKSVKQRMAESRKEIENSPEQLHLNNCKLTGLDTTHPKTLQEAIGGKPRLMMRFSDQSCDVCVNDLLDKLTAASDKIGNENIIILSSFRVYRSFYLFYKKYSNRFTIYNMKDSKMGFKAEYYDAPFLFKVNSQLIGSDLFVPFKENPLPTVEYLYNAESFFNVPS
ncbi:hypothetical protein [Chitinophaga sp. 212800010-3]|uniref:hypothetical protein n=1 Tax=unclassified Chitinophaga TaxID=2619133 RepID=UPI002DF2F233|nr:hypothetical protein [Chitinophaga sp. 212800010-3]